MRACLSHIPAHARVQGTHDDTHAALGLPGTPHTSASVRGVTAPLIISTLQVPHWPLPLQFHTLPVGVASKSTATCTKDEREHRAKQPGQETKIQASVLTFQSVVEFGVAVEHGLANGISPAHAFAISNSVLRATPKRTRTQHRGAHAHRSARALTYASQGIFCGPPCTETDAICTEAVAEACAGRERRANGAAGRKALAAPAATAMRAT